LHAWFEALSQTGKGYQAFNTASLGFLDLLPVSNGGSDEPSVFIITGAARIMAGNVQEGGLLSCSRFDHYVDVCSFSGIEMIEE
jgi:hypothetical protein